MNYTLTTILIALVVAYLWNYRHAIIRVIDNFFLHKKKRDFVNNNEKMLGRRYSKKFWDMYN